MANQIKYQVKFDVQQNGLSQLKTSLQELQKMKISDIMKINNTDTASATSALIKIKEQAKNVEDALKQAFNTKLNTVNVQAFNQSLKKSGTSMEQIYRTFSTAGAAGDATFRRLSSSVLNTNIQLKETHSLLDRMATTLTNTIKWNLASSAINMVTRSVQQAWGYVKQLDTSLNDIRIVTGKSADEMAKFSVEANKAARELGKTTTDYTNAALIYAQQGLSDKEVEERARITLKAANVTGQSTDAVSEQLTAVWNGYKVTAEEAELYVDRLAAVAATTASDLEELSTGMSKVASAASAMGVGQDQLAAQLSTIISVTKQAPESVGTALRTVYARISDIKAGLDEDGVTLGNYSGKMADLGINVLDMNGNLRDMGEVMEEIGGKWDTLTREQQIYLAQTMAGQRQYNNLLALFDNFEQYNEALATAQNAAGTLQEQQDIYMESTKAHLQTLKASVEGIYNSLVDTNSINGLIDGLSKTAGMATNLIDSLGGGKAILQSLGAIGLSVFSDQIAKGINTTITNLQIANDNARQFDQSLQAIKEIRSIDGLNKDFDQLLANRQQILQLGKLMTPEQFSGMQSLLNNITELSSEISILEEQTQPLQKVIDLVSNHTLEETMGNRQLQDDITTKIEAQIENYQTLAEKIQGVQQVTLNFDNSQKNLDTGIRFEEATSAAESYINKIHELNATGQLDQHQNEVIQLEQIFQNLPKQVGEDTEATFNQFNFFFNKLKQLFLQKGAELSGSFEDLTKEWADPVITKKLEERRAELEKLVNEFVTGQERMKRAADIKNYANMASGIARVGSAIQQIQNLGSIWKNSDLSTGQKLLKTITNLAISLPMLIGGFTKATTALGLMKTLTTEQAVLAGRLTVAQAAHAFSIKLVGDAATETNIRIKLLNTTILLNPYVAVAAGVVALITALGALSRAADKTNKKLIESKQAEIEAANAKQEEIEKNKELYNSAEELNEQYENGQISRAELKSAIEDLIDQYGLEGEAAENLTNDYNNLTQAIMDARKAAAEEALRSAQDEKKAAKTEISASAKGTFGDNAWQSGENYFVRIGAGTAGAHGLFADEPEQIEQLMTEAGAVFADHQSSDLSWVTSFDTASIVELYDTISGVVEKIRELNESGEITDAQLSESEYYQNMLDYLERMEPAITHYRDALKDVAKYQTELDAITAQSNNIINLKNVKTANDYLKQRQKLIKQIQATLDANGDTEANASDMADAYLRDNFRNLYNRFDEAANLIEDVRERFGEENLSIETMIGDLDPQHFAALTDMLQLHPSLLTSWEKLGEFINYIAQQDLSNVKDVTGIEQAQATAMQNYNVYTSVQDSVKNGKRIKSEEYQKLDPEAQSFFSIMADGTYKMTGDAQDFYELINNLKIKGFEDTISQINTQLAKTEELQQKNFNYNELNQSAATFPQISNLKPGLSGGLSNSLNPLEPPEQLIDYDLAQKQLDYLRLASDWDQEVLNGYQDLINTHELGVEACAELAAGITQVGDVTKDTGERQEQLAGQLEEVEAQAEDATFPIDDQLEALKISQTQLEEWANKRGIILDGTAEQTQKAIDAFKLTQDLDDLNSLVQIAKKGGQEGELALYQLTERLNQLTGGDYTSAEVTGMLDAIALAAQDDGVQIQNVLDLMNQLENYTPENALEKMSSADKYRGIQSTSTNLSGAYDALSTGKELTDEQSTALNQLILKNEQLAELSREQGINSQAFLKVLQLIVQATEQEAIEAGKIAIQELKAKQARLSEQINSVGTKTEDIRAAEKLSNWERQLQETTAQRLAIEQQLTIEWQKQADAAQNIDQLESAKLAGMDENTFEKNLDAAAGREAKSLGLDEDEVLDYATALQECADQSDDLADSLENDRDASLQLAIAGKRLTRGIKDLTQNFDKYNQQINSDNIEEQAQGFGHLRDAMGDILNIDGNLLTKGFLTDNLQDMKLAAEGDIDAIDRLRQAAADDIIQQCLVKLDGSEQVQAKLLNLSNQIESFLSQDIQLGVNLDDSDFIAKCNKLITEAGMTQDQIQAYFNSLGFDPKISYIPTNSLPVESTTEGTVNVAGLIDIPYTMTATSTTKVQVPRIESLTKIGGGAHSGAITNAPAPSSSGGKGRGGGGGKGKSPKKGGGSKKSGKTNKKDLEKPIEDQRDIYHDINIQLSQLERNFDRIQKDQEKLYGKQLLDNLNKQQKLLDKQIETLRRKQKLQEQDLANQKQKLRGLGVEVNEQGDIINYMDALGQKQDKVNSLIAEENALIQKRNKLKNKEKQDALDQLIEKKKKEVDAAKDDLDKTENAIKDYDDLRNDMEDLIDDIEDLIDQQIEINIEKFNAKVEMTLELGQAEREWNEFRRNVLENKDFMIRTDFDDIFADLQQNVDDFYSYFDVHGSIGGIETLTQHLHDIQKEINDIDEKGQSAIYGKNKAKAMEDLQNNLDKLMDQMENIEKISEDIDKAYLDTIDDIEEHFSKQGQEYEYVNDLIQHDMDLLSLLYGDKNYAAMNNYYETLRKHNLDQLDSLKLQRDFWKEQMENALNQGDTKAAEKFRENYKDVIQDLNSLVKDSVETLRDQYSNVIEEIFDDLDKKVSNGHGTDYLSDQWDLMNKNADEYLDNINSAFAIQQTERKYQNAINDTKNIKNQQALKKLMDQQLDILKDKEKLTQYDVDRAEKLLQVEQARIALQDARAAKTTMRLKRDAQGNYSYEYAADEDAIGQAEANLAAAQNDLYNFDKDHYKSNLDDILSAWKDFQQEYKDIVLDTSLTEEARVEKIALLRDQYGEYINGKLSENKNIRGNLMDSAFKDYAKLYNTDVENYKNMTDAQKQILMQNLVPAWGSGIQQMADKITGEDGLVGVCEQAFKDIAEASDSYQTNVNKLSKVSGLNFDDLKQGRDEIIDAFKETIQKNQDLIITMGQEITSVQSLRDNVQSLKEKYDELAEAAKTALTQGHDALQEYRKAQLEVFSNPEMAEVLSHENSSNGQDQITESLDQEIENINTWQTINKGESIDYEPLKQNNTGKISSYIKSINSFVKSDISSLIKQIQAVPAGFLNLLTDLDNNNNNNIEQTVYIDANFPNVDDWQDIIDAFSDIENKAIQKTMQ